MSRPSTLPQLGAWLPVVLLVIVAYVVPRLLNSDYLFEAILLPFLALSLAGVGLNVLTGYTGQVSLGSAAFMAIGAYAAFNINLRIAGVPLPVTILAAGVIAAVVGVAFGLPSLRLRGFYLAVSTLAAQFFVQWALTKFPWFSNDFELGRHRRAEFAGGRVQLRLSARALRLRAHGRRAPDGALLAARVGQDRTRFHGRSRP